MEGSKWGSKWDERNLLRDDLIEAGEDSRFIGASEFHKRGSQKKWKCLDEFHNDLAKACISLSVVEDLVFKSEKAKQSLILKCSVGW